MSSGGRFYKGRVQLGGMKIINSAQSVSKAFLLSNFASPVAMLAVLAFIFAAAVLGPNDRILGGNLRLILLHGAWVWTGMLLFAASALVGLAALGTRRPGLHAGSLALGRAGLAFWLTYLPMSLLVMQLNWGGFYFDEPRWSTPFSFAVIGTLLQIGLLLINHRLISSTANLLFGVALWVSLQTTSSVLHPESPISQSGSGIQLYFFLLLAMTILLGLQLAYFLYRRAKQAE
jgi:hypothetical protein